MAIQFLQDYATKATPPEAFVLGQVVEGRDEASEGHFVNRGYAAYLVDGKLIDRFGKEVAEPAPASTADDGGQGGMEPEVDINRANKAQLMAIAQAEEVPLPKGDETTVKELRAAIEEHRKTQAAPTA